MHCAIADDSDAPHVIHRVTIQGGAPTSAASHLPRKIERAYIEVADWGLPHPTGFAMVGADECRGNYSRLR